MVKLARQITIHIVAEYDKTVEVLRAAVKRAGIDRSERVAALKRLVKFGEERVRRRMAEQTEPGQATHNEAYPTPEKPEAK